MKLQNIPNYLELSSLLIISYRVSWLCVVYTDNISLSLIIMDGSSFRIIKKSEC